MLRPKDHQQYLWILQPAKPNSIRHETEELGGRTAFVPVHGPLGFDGDREDWKAHPSGAFETPLATDVIRASLSFDDFVAEVRSFAQQR